MAIPEDDEKTRITLVAGNLIELGKTTLRFVPFCGADCDWQEQTGA